MANYSTFLLHLTGDLHKISGMCSPQMTVLVNMFVAISAATGSGHPDYSGH